MCELSNGRSSSLLTATASDSERNYLRKAFTILRVEVNKSDLNLKVSSEESSPSATSFGEIELKICRDVEEMLFSHSHSEQNESEERENWLCRKEKIGELDKSEDCCKEESSLEYTLAIIKPEALIYRKEIERLMVEEGFNICQTRWLQLTPEQVSDFYFDNYEQESFARLVSCMSLAPIIVHVISKSNGIADWKRLMGPENLADARAYAPDSIRGKYGQSERVDNEMRKFVHGSADKRSAEKEIRYFFPDRKIETAPREEAALQYLWNEINQVLTEGLIKCCEEKPNDPVAWLGNWLLDHKINSPKYLCMHE